METGVRLDFLLPRWNPFTERFGLLLCDWDVVEFPNESETPSLGLRVDQKKVAPYLPRAIATWHTHPQNNVNLSATDYAMFLTMPGLIHYIVTERRIRSFRVLNKKVMLHEADCV